MSVDPVKRDDNESPVYIDDNERDAIARALKHNAIVILSPINVEYSIYPGFGTSSEVKKIWIYELIRIAMEIKP